MSYFKSIKQDIETSNNNYSEANILSGATWTGGTDETLGINGIQVFHSADVDCTVYVDQNVGSYQVYDGIDNTGVLMADVDAVKVLGSLEFGAPFSDGLYIESNAKITVIYE